MPAPEDGQKHCLVAIDTPQGPWMCELLLPIGATVAIALEQARTQLESEQRDHAINWEAAVTGLWGAACQRSVVPRDGDRIELYLPLTADPRQRRRQRVLSARRT